MHRLAYHIHVFTLQNYLLALSILPIVIQPNDR